MQQVQPSPFTESKDNMATTYEKIQSYTLGSASASIDFTSIGSGYTDLRVVYVCTQASANSPIIKFNSDSGSNYSQTSLYGTGTSAVSGRETNATRIYLNQNGSASTTIPGLYTLDIFSYAGGTYKTLIITSENDKNGSGIIENNVALWRSTSAITSISIFASAGNINAGSTATLYGILKA
jgi:hypothetical protein